MLFAQGFFHEYVQHRKNSTFGWGFLWLQAVRNHAKQLWRWVSSEKLVGVVCVFFLFLPLHFRAKWAMKKPCCLGYIGDETLPSNMRLYRAQMLLLLFVPKWSMVIHQHLSVGVPKKNQGWQGVPVPTTWFMGWNNSHYSRVISPQLPIYFVRPFVGVMVITPCKTSELGPCLGRRGTPLVTEQAWHPNWKV